MNRRGLLSGVTLITATLAGCLGSPGNDSARPTKVENSQFETGVETNSRGIFGPKITVDQEAATVTVEGISEYGSSSCGYLRLQHVDYDTEQAVLQVAIGSGSDEPSEEQGYCGDDVGADSYRVVVRFDEGVPKRVEAKQTFGRENTEEFD
ncbi:hypothetical protein HYG81_18695 [Natrinema zhouii]|uniref:hypothetical protein n=1 Tax=Natrinema zhouii TaxID=1710539 RepID=UPI001CFF55C6|nr:hypothetical protein [Natrinema zhouii]UHQ97964.1 hypothetical protein HYG81_18695 [Natrinema zhouii]